MFMIQLIKKSPVFIAFENKYRASSTAYKEANVEIDKLEIIDAVVDKIVPPQSTESLDVTVEEFGSIVLEDQPIKPFKSSEVVSYGDYEKDAKTNNKLSIGSTSTQTCIEKDSKCCTRRSKFEVWRGSGRLLGAFWFQDSSQTLLRRFIDAFWEALGRQVGAKLEAKWPPWVLLGASWRHL